MPLEQEALSMISGGLTIIMGITFFFTILFWLRQKKHHAGFALTILSLMLLSLAGRFMVEIFQYDVTHPMASEEISLQLGVSGITWAFSMVCLILGIYHFTKDRPNVG